MIEKYKTILVVMSDLPFPANSGGKIDYFYKLKALKEFGCNVFVVASYSDPSALAECDSVLSAMGIKTFFYPRKKSLFSTLSFIPYYVFSSRLEKMELDEVSRFLKDVSFDMMIIDHLNSFYAAKQIENIFSPSKVVYRAHNIESQFLKRQFLTSRVSILRRLILAIDTLKMFFYEKHCLKKINHIASISQAEIGYFQQKSRSANVFWLPPFFNQNVKTSVDEFDVKEKEVYEQLKSDFKNKKILFFANNFTNGFNVDATTWFLENVWPQIIDAVPEAHFIMAGRNAGNYFDSSECVTVVNGFDSVAPYMFIADVVLILTFGKEGVKLKLMEAISFNKIIISTDEGVWGSGLEKYAQYTSNNISFAELCISSIHSKGLSSDLCNVSRFFCDGTEKVKRLLN